MGEVRVEVITKSRVGPWIVEVSDTFVVVVNVLVSVVSVREAVLLTIIIEVEVVDTVDTIVEILVAAVT